MPKTPLTAFSNGYDINLKHLFCVLFLQNFLQFLITVTNSCSCYYAVNLLVHTSNSRLSKMVYYRQTNFNFLRAINFCFYRCLYEITRQILSFGINTRLRKLFQHVYNENADNNLRRFVDAHAEITNIRYFLSPAFHINKV